MHGKCTTLISNALVHFSYTLGLVLCHFLNRDTRCHRIFPECFTDVAHILSVEFLLLQYY